MVFPNATRACRAARRAFRFAFSASATRRSSRLGLDPCIARGSSTAMPCSVAHCHPFWRTRSLAGLERAVACSGSSVRASLPWWARHTARAAGGQARSQVARAYVAPVVSVCRPSWERRARRAPAGSSSRQLLVAVADRFGRGSDSRASEAAGWAASQSPQISAVSWRERPRVRFRKAVPDLDTGVAHATRAESCTRRQAARVGAGDRPRRRARNHAHMRCATHGGSLWTCHWSFGWKGSVLAIGQGLAAAAKSGRGLFCLGESGGPARQAVRFYFLLTRGTADARACAARRWRGRVLD
jgi:hypothetical protein